MSHTESFVPLGSNGLPERTTSDDLSIAELEESHDSQGHDCDSKSTLKPRRLLRGEITFADAKEQDANILHQLGYREQKIRFFTHLYRNRELIKTIVACHLGLGTADACSIVDVDEWIHGNFNVCIRVDIDKHRGNSGRQVMVRFPLPYRIGEYSSPGNADEKIRCEIGTYAWLQENCPNVPIPRFYGYGFTAGKQVSKVQTLVWIHIYSIFSPSSHILTTSLSSREISSVYAGGFCAYLLHCSLFVC